MSSLSRFLRAGIDCRASAVLSKRKSCVLPFILSCSVLLALPDIARAQTGSCANQPDYPLGIWNILFNDQRYSLHWLLSLDDRHVPDNGHGSLQHELHFHCDSTRATIFISGPRSQGVMNPAAAELYLVMVAPYPGPGATTVAAVVLS